ncbi:gamma-soluble NSF attachment protein [Hyalella azteca]|uniref:Gamma-soluble NSF attachment protein n=1 Tax=Hyalella azteca TaxID=294128 RepID=A0A8B7NX03_HYAAZ|nr:gamma-soluble NSF attachment protein [Hyalella azteca]
MAANKKVEEALAHIRDAEKCLKTGLLKWNPDYDEAADYYNKAAVCYKAARQHPQCVQCYIKASDNYRICRSYFAAAKALENASLISKEMGELDSVAQLAERACKLYRDNGTVDTAAMVLDKAAKIIEGTRPQRAVDLYKQAVDIALCEAQPRRAAEYQSKLCRLYVRQHMLIEAAEAIRTNITFFRDGDFTDPISREVVALVLVQIARGDHIAGEKALKEWGAYVTPEEMATLSALLEAFDEQDGEAARRLLRAPFIRSMDVEYSKLARDMDTPASKKEEARNGEEGLEGSSGAQGGDEEELDLC